MDCGPQWTKERLHAAVLHGPHPSATKPDAVVELWKEANEKVAQGFATILPWDTLKDHPPATLKVSPIAMIPHKSRKFCAILDLSYQLNISGTLYPSVNDATNKQAPSAAMDQIGGVLPQLFETMAHADQEAGPLVFSKLDIKDGFWRMVVPHQTHGILRMSSHIAMVIPEFT
ncbi:MAG: hypothetical protein ACRDL7_04840 [Gaiellaceae bacterium]